MPENYKFGGGAGDTTLTPIVMVLLALAFVLVIVVPRKYVIVPVIFSFYLVPVGQMVLLGGVHLYVSRIVILTGCIRALLSCLTSHESVVGGWNSVDRAFLWYVLCDGIAVILLFRQVPAVINQVGYLWDYLGGYFLLRFFIRDEEDIFRLIKCFAVLTVIQGASMIWEYRTMQNVFGYLGGARSPELREGKIRCQGVFEHTLMAGAFAATLPPLFYLMWKSGKSKMLAAAGFFGSAVMTWTTNSSTPLLAYGAGVFALCLWPIRKKMRMVRWGIVMGLLGLQLVMKAPIWFLIARVDLTGGSSSYHRAELVDQFIRHFSNWWLIGTNDSFSWGLDMWDVQNQYVNVGETGGLLALIFFIAMISRAFARVGNARKLVENDRQKEWFFWCLGSALFAHVVGFFGVNYFDQSRYAWFALLVMICAATVPILQTQTAELPEAAVTLTSSLTGGVTQLHDPIGNPPYTLPGAIQGTKG